MPDSIALTMPIAKLSAGCRGKAPPGRGVSPQTKTFGGWAGWDLNIRNAKRKSVPRFQPLYVPMHSQSHGILRREPTPAPADTKAFG